MIQAICWVLIHSLWQGLLLALAGGGVILCTKRSAAALRYRLLCGLLGLFLAGLGFTMISEWKMSSASGDGGGEFGVSINWLGEWFLVHGYQVVAVWLLVVAGKSVRMAAGWSYMRRMRREGLAAQAVWAGRMDVLSRRLGMRRAVKLVESALVRVPMVIGQLKPVIYVPLGLVNHLPAGEMEAVLLHELAHIRRYDYLVNMIQQAAECLLFFNPGFLWVSSLVREERENSCDDIAIAHTRDRVEFVRALVRFKEHSLRGMALAFPGDRRQLLNRVLRISRQENKTLSGKERLVLFVGCMVLLCLLAARAGTMKTEKNKKVAAIENVAVAPVQPELVSVLRAQQQVTENMEWVKAELDRLHQKKERPSQNDKRMKLNKDQVRRNQKQVGRNLAEAEREHEQVERDRQQAERDRVQADRDRVQADRDREQAERDRQEAEKERDRNREQAERDRQQAERARLQAGFNREQAELKRNRDELSRQKAVLDRLKGEHDRLVGLAEKAVVAEKAEVAEKAAILQIDKH